MVNTENIENIENIDNGDIWSLNSIDEMLREEFQRENYEQALGLAKKGLDEASKTNDKHWIDEFTKLKDDLTKFILDRKIELSIKQAEKEADSGKFDEAIKFFKQGQDNLDELDKLGKIDYTNKDQLENINKRLEELQEKAKTKSSQKSSLNSFTDYDDLTIIKGIGNSAELKLNGAGIYTVSQLVKSTPSKISRIKGFGVNLSEQIISAAKELISKNGTPEVKKSPKYPKKAKNLLDFEKELKNPGLKNGEKKMNKTDPMFESKFSIDRTSKSVPPPMRNRDEQYDDSDDTEVADIDELIKEFENVYNNGPSEGDYQEELKGQEIVEEVSFKESSIEQEYDNSQELNYDNENGSHVEVDDIEQDTDNINNFEDDITEVSVDFEPQLETFIERNVIQEDKLIENDVDIQTKFEDAVPQHTVTIDEDIEIEKQVVLEKEGEKYDSFTDNISSLNTKNYAVNKFLNDNDDDEIDYRAIHTTTTTKEPINIRSVLNNKAINKNVSKMINRRQVDELDRLKDEFIEESLTKDKLKAFQNRIERDLRALKYVIIPKSLGLVKYLSKYIDLLAVKVLRVEEYTELIIILPVKVFTLNGIVMVSYDKIDYRPTKNLNDNAKSLLLKPNLVGLKKACDLMFQNITNEGNLFRFFKKYLKDGITVEKTKSKKRLFFCSGPTQYKLLIEPILTCQNEPVSLEKSLLFPYQRQSNFHVINLGVLPALTRFLEKKYELIETHLEQESTIKSYFNAVDSLVVDIKLYSIPFVIFGFIFSLILIFQANLVLNVFISLGYAAISIYGVILFYLYFKFYKKKSKIIEDFNTPYHLTKFKMDETDLIMINEELDTELMNQFIYECFGKDLDFNLIAQLEEERSYKFINANGHNKTNNGSSETKHSFNKSTANRIKSKYSSFLED